MCLAIWCVLSLASTRRYLRSSMRGSSRCYGYAMGPASAAPVRFLACVRRSRVPRFSHSQPSASGKLKKWVTVRNGWFQNCKCKGAFRPLDIGGSSRGHEGPTMAPYGTKRSEIQNERLIISASSSSLVHVLVALPSATSSFSRQRLTEWGGG